MILTFHHGRGIHCLSIGTTMKTKLSRSDASDIPRGDFKRGIADVIVLKGHYHDVANARTWSVFFHWKTIELSLCRVMPIGFPCDKLYLYPICLRSYRKVLWNSSNKWIIERLIKLDVTWPYVKRQTAKITSEIVFFSSNPLLNHIKK